MFVEMKLKKMPDFQAFLSNCLSNADPERDEQVTRDFMASAGQSRCEAVLKQAKQLMSEASLPLEEFGSEGNRWFADEAEAQIWLERIVAVFETAGPSDESSSAIVKDSNGSPLSEGDTVQVIKDLKVKGGSSDLKRGTMIKKIHLTGDTDAIECRVDGSTLVLKTCFLKKA